MLTQTIIIKIIITMAKLFWTAKATYFYPEHNSENDWIILNGEKGVVNGVGNMPISVKLSPSTTVNDPDTGGTITFTCTNCGEGFVKTVFVKRCSLHQ